MVAPAESRKPRRRKSSAIVPAVPVPSTGPWPIEHELTVRRLYVVDGMGASDIAASFGASVGRDVKSIRNLIDSRRWSPEKRAKQAAVRSNAQAEINARVPAEVERIVTATAVLAEEASLGALKRAHAETTGKGRGAAKNFRAWAAGARDLVSVARVSRGLDARMTVRADEIGQSAVAINFFVGGGLSSDSPKAPGTATARDCKTVGPVVDVVATPLPMPPPTPASNPKPAQP